MKLHALLVTLLSAVTLPAAAGSGTLPTETVNVPETTADGLSRDRFSYTMGIDLMSSYVCRGSYQTGPSLQPALQVGYGGLYFTAWGSVGEEVREADLTLAYRLQRFELAVTDYYVTGSAPGTGRDFFDYGRRSPHTLEISLAWTLSKRVPIALWWGTMVAGNDFGDDGRRNYSTYAEISYPFLLPLNVEVKTGVGCTPWATENCLGTRGFAVTNVYLHAARRWSVGGNLRLGLLARLICNPYKEEFNFVGGLSLHM